MSNEDQFDGELPQVSELDSLKARADLLGIKYHPSIGLDSLRAKVTAKLNDEPDPETAAPVLTKAPAVVEETENQRRQRLKKEANKLVRVNIQCRNPAKKEWDGEIITVGNSIVGTFRKYVPFDTTEGYHIPQIILNVLKERECQTFRNAKTKLGVTVRESKLIKEFSIDYLDPLTPAELEELARRQALAAGQTV